MIGKRFSFLMAIALMAIMGCSGGGAAVTYYTLQPAAALPTAPTPLNVDIGVGPVVLPDYLDRDTLVTRVSRNQLSVHQQHRWAGSLKNEILRVLTINLKAACPGAGVRSHPWSGPGKPDLRFRLSILQFDGPRAGHVDLKVAWTVESDLGPALRRETQLRQEIDGDDLEAYAAAMGYALAGLAGEMAKDVIRITETVSTH
jgi:uncharacterized lipoprotein YmbA